jgi:branched-chain amino acid transport system ATP-binding protein
VSLLEVGPLEVAYNGVTALWDVSLAVPANGIVTVIGPNGAGKTTLLNAVMGVLPSRGRIDFAGRDIRRLAVEERVALGLALVPERRELFTGLSVEDNLRLGAWRSRRETGSLARGLDAVYARFPRLFERRRQVAGTLSGGERQMLAMGRALMAQPRLLLLDEPSLGLAPLIVREVLRAVVDLRRAGMAVLLVEQNARAALQVADHGYVLEMGRVAAAGAAAELAADPRLLTTYLGGAVS